MDISGCGELGVELLRMGAGGVGSGRSGKSHCAHISPLCKDHPSLPSQARGATKPALIGSMILSVFLTGSSQKPVSETGLAPLQL